MNNKSVSCLTFSPTGTTKTISEAIAQGMKAKQIHYMDCTKRSDRETNSFMFTGDVAILAVPVYYGRVPEEIVPFLNSLKSGNKPVVLVVVYGNREYEDALLELHDIASARGFIPLAGAAFIGEHSYSTVEKPIAHARPDTNDIGKAETFGLKIKEMMDTIASPDEIKKFDLPGNTPYVEPENLHNIKEARNVLSFTPETDSGLCSDCGKCAEVCPTGAVDPDNVSQINKWECQICFACIKNCPEKAKKMTDTHFLAAIDQLYQMNQERKEPEMYFFR